MIRCPLRVWTGKMSSPDVKAEQEEAYRRVHIEGQTREQAAAAMGLSFSAIKRRLRGAARAQMLDPELRTRLEGRGITDFSGLHSGWLIEKDENGGGQSLYFYLGPDQERIDFAEAMRDALFNVDPLPPIPPAKMRGNDLCNIIGLADLHVGRNYGSRQIYDDAAAAIDDIVSRLPPAEKAILVELGDLLDANDHKGVTPSSGNPCDVIRHDHLGNTQQAIRIMRRAIDRLAESHAEVEVHLLRGNHDESAYIAVMLALEAAYSASEQIRVVVTDQDYRVIPWGACALFPHHGDRAKWAALKDIWADQFPDAWAKAKRHRAIWTAHLHHNKAQDMVGVECKHFRTVARRQQWEKESGYFSRGTLSAETWHKSLGFVTGTYSHIVTPTLEELQ